MAQRLPELSQLMGSWALSSIPPARTDSFPISLGPAGDFPGLDQTPSYPSLPPLFPVPFSNLGTRRPKEEVPAEEGGIQEPAGAWALGAHKL